jgi:hypothetical protein
MLACLSALLGAGAGVSALRAAPAHAFDGWQHDGATDCTPCHNTVTTPGDSSCQACHGSAFKPVPGFNCWSCHAPGQDTSAWQTSAGCSTTCHLWNPSTLAYDVTFTHGTTPHLGASGFGKTCTDCHGVSLSPVDPDGSPHHSGQTLAPPTCRDCHNGTIASKKANHDSVKPPCTACHTGMNIPPQPQTCNKCHAARTFGKRVCTSCHSPTGIFKQEQVHNTHPTVGACTSCHKGLQKHAGRVACKTCHSKAKPFHHHVAKTPGFPKCTKCHAVTHSVWRIPASKCASCHKGKNAAARHAVQHSARITRSVTCTRCHNLQVHARAFTSSITCGTCHGSGFHGRKFIPSSSSCLRCHGSAAAHAVGFPCLICHASAVHNARPTAGGLIGR